MFPATGNNKSSLEGEIIIMRRSGTEVLERVGTEASNGGSKSGAAMRKSDREGTEVSKFFEKTR
jgi:hypothetical protein